MKHFIITRFNLKNTAWKNSRDGEIVLTDAWLKHRFELFENFTFPSVKHQSCDTFKWLVFFDSDTPETYRYRIQNFEKQFSNFQPIFIDGLVNLNRAVIDKIAESLKVGDDFIITTRLDNDDIIHTDFVKTIQAQFIPKAKTLIDVRLGFQLILKDKCPEYRLFNKPFNPFLSLIEHTDDFETVISKSHHHWKSYTSIKIVQKSTLWIQLVHDKNLVARPNLHLKKVGTPSHNDFGCSLPESETSKLKLQIHNILQIPFRLFRKLKMHVTALKNKA